jgi:hypothetical protein
MLTNRGSAAADMSALARLFLATRSPPSLKLRRAKGHRVPPIAACELRRDLVGPRRASVVEQLSRSIITALVVALVLRRSRGLALGSRRS